MSKQFLQRAVELANGQAPLARLIRARKPDSKIGQVLIWGWLNSVKIEVPPAEYVIDIAAVCDWQITPHQLRPDIYPNPSDGLPQELDAANQPACFECGASDLRSGERRAEQRANVERRQAD